MVDAGLRFGSEPEVKVPLAGNSPTFIYSDVLALNVEADLLVVPAFRDHSPEPASLDIGLADAYALAGLSGDEGEDLLLVHRPGEPFRAGAVLLAGMGARGKVDLDLVRRTALRSGARARRFRTVAITLPQAFAGPAEQAIGATVQGFSEGAHRFSAYRTVDGASDLVSLQTVSLLGKPEWAETDMQGAMDRAAVIERAVTWVRNLVDTPAADLPPVALADQAIQMADTYGLEARVLDETALGEGGFGGILGVGAGSRHPPRMIELRYEPREATSPALIGLTGKGVTFDSGGLALKKLKDMFGMKSDMAGAAAVLGAMRAIAELSPPHVGVLAVIPSAENMPGSSALRPGDVLRHRNGMSTEVVDPDAEGRLLLADALAYLAESQPSAIVDVATLTYSCIAALGTEITAAVGNDRALMETIVTAGDAVGEPIWELPLWQRYRSQLRSGVADSRNEGEEGVAGAIVAALFLERFVSGTPWVHLDIGGSGYRDEPTELMSAGGTGVPARTLVDFVMEMDRGQRLPRSRDGRTGKGVPDETLWRDHES